ncbi:MAG: chorismate-binding protein, partial [Bacteroidota bacterium]
QATIHPIAGTFRRTGNDEEDRKLAKKLFDDPKENAEHVMLVDLARNDLSRNGGDVKVNTYKEIQYFSHVIHLVSKVTATIDPTVSSMQLVADTFPAGTLSGAPKHRAMQLIEANEKGNRGYYGGCIGYLSFNGNFNQAIMIRSFLSKQNVLYYQAGAGVVSKSVPESELQEVHNKLAALRNALELANTINR